MWRPRVWGRGDGERREARGAGRGFRRQKSKQNFLGNRETRGFQGSDRWQTEIKTEFHWPLSLALIFLGFLLPASPFISCTLVNSLPKNLGEGFSWVLVGGGPPRSGAQVGLVLLAINETPSVPEDVAQPLPPASDKG